MRIFISCFLLALTLAAAYVYFAPLEEPTLPRQRLRAKGQVTELESIVSTANDPSALRTFLNSKSNVVSLDGSQIYRALQSRSNYIWKPLDSDWDKTQRFTDPWTNSYYFQFETITNLGTNTVWQLKVRSFGPNGLDEHGKGDDITSKGVILNWEN